jgi:hypothetical protein
MTIAEKHLSKHGRFGDTEIASTSNGELWHVNKFEKKLMDDYGVVGERLVDISGSGTTNPTTGLKEQYIQAIAAAGALGLSLYQGAKQTSMERESAQAKLGLTESQLEELSRSQGLLTESKIGFAYSGDIESAKSDSVTDVRKAEESLMASYGMKIGDVIGMYESEKARIKSERERLESEKKLYESMSKTKFLGIF